MTQKKIGDDLYVFKQEAYEITQDTDAEKIFIQLELIDAFKALNERSKVLKVLKVLKANKVLKAHKHHQQLK